MVTLKLTRQMQGVILGIFLACGVLFAVIHFIMAPLAAEKRTNRKKAEEIQARLKEMRAVIQARPEVQQTADETQKKIRQMAEAIPLPVLGNYLLGMEANIRAGVKDLPVQISQVVNQDILDLEGTGFKAYRVRVTAQAGFHALIRLFQNLEAGNPLCAISGLTITPRDENRETHDVAFTVSWLVWADPSKRPAFLLKSEPKERKSEP